MFASCSHVRQRSVESRVLQNDQNPSPHIGFGQSFSASNRLASSRKPGKVGQKSGTFAPARCVSASGGPTDCALPMNPEQPQPRVFRTRGAEGRGIPMGSFLLLMAWAALAWISKLPQGSPLLYVALIQIFGWGLLWFMDRVWCRMDAGLDSVFARFLGWALAFRLAAWFGTPLLEDDYARYLWDGWRMLQGGNPYEHAPLHYFGDPSVPAVMQGVLDLVNHPHIPTLYGPGLQLWFGAAAWLGLGSLSALKLLLLLADLGVIALVRHLGGSRAALLYAWCPLVIFETVFNAHAEILAVLPLLAGIALQRTRRRFMSGLMLGVSVATKLTALPAVPFVIRPLDARGWVGFATGILALYLPFGIQSGEVDRAGLAEFLATWEFNSSLVGLLGVVLPTPWSRWLSMALVAPILFVAWRKTVRDGMTLPRLDLVFGMWFLGSAVVNPWYLLWMAPFAALFPTRLAWVALASVTLSYATSMNLGLNLEGPYNHPWWVRPLEYGAVLIAWLWPSFRPSGNASGTSTEPSKSAG